MKTNHTKDEHSDVEEIVEEFKSWDGICHLEADYPEGWNDAVQRLRTTLTQHHQDMVSEVQSVDIEQNRELYGTDFAAGMEKMKNIIIKNLTRE